MHVLRDVTEEPLEEHIGRVGVRVFDIIREVISNRSPAVHITQRDPTLPVQLQLAGIRVNFSPAKQTESFIEGFCRTLGATYRHSGKAGDIRGR
jgi:hypothetical protein